MPLSAHTARDLRAFVMFMPLPDQNQQLMADRETQDALWMSKTASIRDHKYKRRVIQEVVLLRRAGHKVAILDGGGLEVDEHTIIRLGRDYPFHPPSVLKPHMDGGVVPKWSPELRLVDILKRGKSVADGP